MGENGDWVQPSGIFPNGMLPNTGPLIHLLESDRWLKAEERTADLISRIQPNQPSEERRNAVADYVQRLIMKCFPCQVVFSLFLQLLLFSKILCCYSWCAIYFYDVIITYPQFICNQAFIHGNDIANSDLVLLYLLHRFN